MRFRDTEGAEGEEVKESAPGFQVFVSAKSGYLLEDAWYGLMDILQNGRGLYSITTYHVPRRASGIVLSNWPT